jgi:hypothetical protein
MSESHPGDRRHLRPVCASSFPDPPTSPARLLPGARVARHGWRWSVRYVQRDAVLGTLVVLCDVVLGTLVVRCRARHLGCPARSARLARRVVVRHGQPALPGALLSGTVAAWRAGCPARSRAVRLMSRAGAIAGWVGDQLPGPGGRGGAGSGQPIAWWFGDGPNRRCGRNAYRKGLAQLKALMCQSMGAHRWDLGEWTAWPTRLLYRYCRALPSM